MFITRAIAEFIYEVRRELEKYERLELVAQEVGKLEIKEGESDDHKGPEIPAQLQHTHMEQPLRYPDQPFAFGFQVKHDRERNNIVSRGEAQERR